MYKIMRDILYYNQKLELARYFRLHTQSCDRSKIEYYESLVKENEMKLIGALINKYEE